MFGRHKTGLDALFDRPKPSQWATFVAAPLTYLAKILYWWRLSQQTIRRNQKAIKVAGDLIQSGSVQEIQAALAWLNSLSHEHKVVIAGTHDCALDSDETIKWRWDGIKYLRDNSTEILSSNGRALKVFGSPWTPTPGTWAYQYSRDEDVWTNKVPIDTDILITHIPPRFHLDIAGFSDGNLLKELWRLRPRIHVYGHIHEGYGRDSQIYDQFERLMKIYSEDQGAFWYCLECFASL